MKAAASKTKDHRLRYCMFTASSIDDLSTLTDEVIRMEEVESGYVSVGLHDGSPCLSPPSDLTDTHISWNWQPGISTAHAIKICPVHTDGNVYCFGQGQEAHCVT